MELLEVFFGRGEGSFTAILSRFLVWEGLQNWAYYLFVFDDLYG